MWNKIKPWILVAYIVGAAVSAAELRTVEFFQPVQAALWAKTDWYIAQEPKDWLAAQRVLDTYSADDPSAPWNHAPWRDRSTKLDIYAPLEVLLILTLGAVFVGGPIVLGLLALRSIVRFLIGLGRTAVARVSPR